jgi:hypothetical protein
MVAYHRGSARKRKETPMKQLATNKAAAPGLGLLALAILAAGCSPAD